MKKQKINKPSFSFQRISDEFRQLNPNDPGVWPATPRFVALAALFLITLVVAWFVVLNGHWDDLVRRQDEEKELKVKWESEKRKAVNLEANQAQLAEIDKQFGALLRQLPDRSKMDALLLDINQAGRGRGLQFELWKPGAEVSKQGFYAELPVTLRVTGSYEDFGNFVSDIAKLPRIVTLKDISIEAIKDGMLRMDATAVTYRYLDDEEMAAQKRDAKGAN